MKLKRVREWENVKDFVPKNLSRMSESEKSTSKLELLRLSFLNINDELFMKLPSDGSL